MLQTLTAVKLGRGGDHTRAVTDETEKKSTSGLGTQGNSPAERTFAAASFVTPLP